MNSNATELDNDVLFNPNQYQEDIKYLAEAIYFEARGEITAGMVAVGEVILNRVSSPRFPNSVKDVVHQRKKVKGKWVAQFSYYSDGKPEVFDDYKSYIKSLQVADYLLNSVDKGFQITDNSTHYFNDSIVIPSWSKRMKYLGKVGNHVFYREFK